MNNIFTEKAVSPPVFEILKVKKGVCKKEKPITSFKYNNFTYTPSNPNNCVQFNGNAFVFMNEMRRTKQENLMITGKN